MNSLDYWLPFIGVAGGYMFGALLTWLLLRNRLNTTRARLEERLRASEKHVADLEAGSANLEQEVSEMRQSESVALKQQGSLEGLLNAERKLSQDKMKLLNKAEERMLASFRLISQECLLEGQEQFAGLIKTTFEERQQESQEDILPLLHPLAESLDRIESRLTTLEDSRNSASELIREQIARAVESDEEPTFAINSERQTTERPITLPVPISERSPSFRESSSTNLPRSSDPRPYAAPAPAPVPTPIPTRPRSSPSTFLEDLDAQPLPSSFQKVSYRSAEAAAQTSGERRRTEALPPVKLSPIEEPKEALEARDVLDQELDDFEGFGAVELKDVPSAPDPKRAADDLRAALES